MTTHGEEGKTIMEFKPKIIKSIKDTDVSTHEWEEFVEFEETT